MIDKALKEQDVEIVINNDFDVSSINIAEFLWYLYHSKKQPNIKFLKLLLEKGANPNTYSSKGLTAFMIVLLFGDYELTQLFVKHGVDISKKIILVEHSTTEEQTSEIDFDEAFEKIKKEENIKIDFFQIITPLTIKSDDKTVEISPFMVAFETYNSDNIKLLIENGADVNETIYSVNGGLGLLNGHFSCTVGLETGLSYAIKKNDTDIALLLLKHGANIDKATYDLAVAMKNGNTILIKTLLSQGVDVNGDCEFFSPYKKTPLDYCIEYSDVYCEYYTSVAKLLIEHGAEIRDEYLMQSLKIKTKYTQYNETVLNISMAKLLIENDADINYVDENGISILMEACNEKGFHDNATKYEFVRYLIEQGADINHQNKLGNSVLMELRDGYYEYTKETLQEQSHYDIFPSELIMNLLLDNGADINARNNIGMSALMKYSMENNTRLVKILLDRGADVNIKSQMTAYDLTQNIEIKDMITNSQNNNPQKLIAILSNFTLDKPLKYSTHYWDFELKKEEYKDFEGFMQAVATNFESIDRELKELSPNLHQKIYTFLFEKEPREDYSWCSRIDINIGWSSLQGLKEHCNSGKKPSEFKLPTIIEMENEDITNFKQVIELFKQEIEIRSEFNNLEEIFELQYDNIGEQFEYDPYQSKLKKQFYTDRESLLNAINSIFMEMGKRAEYPQIEVSTQEREDRSIEITITQINSTLDKDPKELLHKIKNGGGDLGNIKKLLSNLCDWSIEGRFEERDFRVNILKSNNIKDIEISKSSPKGFSHILRFYR